MRSTGLFAVMPAEGLETSTGMTGTTREDILTGENGKGSLLPLKQDISRECH